MNYPHWLSHRLSPELEEGSINIIEKCDSLYETPLLLTVFWYTKLFSLSVLLLWIYLVIVGILIQQTVFTEEIFGSVTILIGNWSVLLPFSEAPSPRLWNHKREETNKKCRQLPILLIHCQCGHLSLCKKRFLFIVNRFFLWLIFPLLLQKLCYCKLHENNIALTNAATVNQCAKVCNGQPFQHSLYSYSNNKKG